MGGTLRTHLKCMFREYGSIPSTLTPLFYSCPLGSVRPCVCRSFWPPFRLRFPWQPSTYPPCVIMTIVHCNLPEHGVQIRLRHFELDQLPMDRKNNHPTVGMHENRKIYFWDQPFLLIDDNDFRPGLVHSSVLSIDFLTKNQWCNSGRKRPCNR